MGGPESCAASWLRYRPSCVRQVTELELRVAERRQRLEIAGLRAQQVLRDVQRTPEVVEREADRGVDLPRWPITASAASARSTAARAAS